MISIRIQDTAWKQYVADVSGPYATARRELAVIRHIGTVPMQNEQDIEVFCDLLNAHGVTNILVKL